MNLSQELLKEIFEKSPTPTVVIQDNLEIIWSNQSFLNLTGVTRQEASGASINNFLVDEIKNETIVSNLKMQIPVKIKTPGRDPIDFTCHLTHVDNNSEKSLVLYLENSVKLELINRLGQATAKVIHDLANPVTVFQSQFDNINLLQQLNRELTKETLLQKFASFEQPLAVALEKIKSLKELSRQLIAKDLNEIEGWTQNNSKNQN